MKQAILMFILLAVVPLGLASEVYVSNDGNDDLNSGAKDSPFASLNRAKEEGSQRMIRVAGMKLVVYPEAKRVRLFNLEEDPHEINDLSGDPAHRKTTQDLFEKLMEKQAEMRDNLILPVYFPDLIVADDARSAWLKLIKTKSWARVWSRPAFEFVEHESGLPNVLIYGDSISIGYTPTVRSALKGSANVYRLHRNGGDSGRVKGYVDEMLQSMKNDELRDPWVFSWDVIHFNVGLHDLKYTSGGKLDKENGVRVNSPEVYAQNLRDIVSYFRRIAPRAKLIFATTTPVPEGEPGRFHGDAARYNEVARKVMSDFPDVLINDLYGFTKPHQPDWWTMPGNVHFNQTGVEKQGEEVARVLRGVLDL